MPRWHLGRGAAALRPAAPWEPQSLCAGKGGQRVHRRCGHPRRHPPTATDTLVGLAPARPLTTAPAAATTSTSGHTAQTPAPASLPAGAMFPSVAGTLAGQSPAFQPLPTPFHPPPPTCCPPHPPLPQSNDGNPLPGARPRHDREREGGGTEPRGDAQCAHPNERTQTWLARSSGRQCRAEGPTNFLPAWSIYFRSPHSSLEPRHCDAAPARRSTAGGIDRRRGAGWQTRAAGPQPPRTEGYA